MRPITGESRYSRLGLSTTSHWWSTAVRINSEAVSKSNSVDKIQALWDAAAMSESSLVDSVVKAGSKFESVMGQCVALYVTWLITSWNHR